MTTAAKNRLIVALDMPTIEEARRLIATLGDSVTFYKVGLELLFAGGLDLAQALKADGKHVFLDMKFLDIGNTVERAVANVTELGLDMLTVHGHDLKTMRAAVSGRGDSKLKLLAVTVLTNLTNDDLAEQGTSLAPADLVLRRALLAQEAGFDGVIASGQEAARIREATGPDFLIVTPGIRLTGSSTDDQQRITTPDNAIRAGASHLVVGRPITQADDPRLAAETFCNHIREAQASL
ncbi:orotidine-5'-phosphate decarboxylase [Hyphomicrobium sulfonivorans]|uniref:Orotidine 5'-phosphate decarboxylase n=1 Tax=Hyphomicrobium sulfonivorans TaxID=121290 RepID=A0A120CUH7_HYPSL|nr:orotidine-5'-phosphate decarboxylase [Hyphomicrobium sulfonivorans]KWT66254.1 Orotidine 5'-phosphate decarboxylase [Hyphomicrobium sulfonivorans]MBI1648595.1 orotidine-5'-phosphate decarboxylase [Hyphomicrobium sulfonivorans]NSL70866.1 orotidine-5'-phosphate decarboxylase [Hyphomicrobium sulfonivorans]